MRRGSRVAIAADDRRPRLGETKLRTHHVDDARSASPIECSFIRTRRNCAATSPPGQRDTRSAIGLSMSIVGTL